MLVCRQKSDYGLPAIELRATALGAAPGSRHGTIGDNRMIRNLAICCMPLTLLSLLSSGCVVVIGTGWGGCDSRVWTDETTQRLTLDTEGVETLQAKTWNGKITFVGTPATDGEAYVIVKKKAGARTADAAAEALAAIDVFVESAEAGTQRIGWKWIGEKKRRWAASVSFEIHAPSQWNLDAETHNGAIDVGGATGDVTVTTHNGRIKVEASGGMLNAETHNGEIEASFAGKDITLVTHNGSVFANLERCTEINGRVTTHNGGVRLSVGKGISTSLNCRTANGRVRCKAPLVLSESGRGRLVGTLGEGAGNLEVTTHNGSVTITSANANG